MRTASAAQTINTRVSFSISLTLLDPRSTPPDVAISLSYATASRPFPVLATAGKTTTGSLTGRVGEAATEEQFIRRSGHNSQGCPVAIGAIVRTSWHGVKYVSL